MPPRTEYQVLRTTTADVVLRRFKKGVFAINDDTQRIHVFDGEAGTFGGKEAALVSDLAGLARITDLDDPTLYALASFTQIGNATPNAVGAQLLQIPTMPPADAFWSAHDSGLNPSAFQSELSGNGASVFLADNSGSTELQTGVTSLGFASRHLPHDVFAFSATSGKHYYQIRGFVMPSFATAPQGYIARAGFLDVFGDAAVVDGVYAEFFRPYVFGVTLVCRNNSVLTSVESAFQPLANTEYDFLIVVDRNVTATLYYRLSAKQAGANPWGWTAATTIASGLPSSRGTTAGITIAKYVGTDTRSLRFASQMACQVKE